MFQYVFVVVYNFNINHLLQIQSDQVISSLKTKLKKWSFMWHH